MGQFKPMVKMMTTEPSVELKLKKGGHVSMKSGKGDHGHKKMADGGMSMMPAMPARGAAAPAAAPQRPSLMARRRAMRGLPAGAGPAAPVGQAARMMAGAAPAMPPQGMPPQGMPTMKKGGDSDTAQDKAMIKKAMKQHDAQEHKGGKGTNLSLKRGGKMATGGVVNGQGGFKAGGVIKSESGSSKVNTATPDRSPAKTGDVKLGNGGGYATGGVAKANGGGYRKGGAAKKAFATGGKVSSGAPVAMPQGRKKPSTPVSINQLSGTFKQGGRVTPGEQKLLNANNAENATNRKAANMYTNESYKSFGKRMNGGGPAADAQTARETKGYEDHYKREATENRAMRDMMNPMNLVRGAVNKLRGLGGVTTTEREVSRTVSPPEKKSGGRIKC
jgi:hypothetical protein